MNGRMVGQPRRALVIASLLTVSLFIAGWSPVVGASHDPTAPVVNKNTDASYTTIQAAIDAASPGDTILVRPGTYAEALNVHIAALTLCSAEVGASDCAYPDADGTTIDAAGLGAPAATIAADDITLRGFEIRGSSPLVVGAGVDRPAIKWNELTLTPSVLSATHGIRISDSSQPVVNYNNIVGNDYPGSISIGLYDTVDPTVALNFLNNGGTSIYFSNAAGGEARGNVIRVPPASQFAGDSLGVSFFMGSGQASRFNTFDGTGVGLSIGGATGVTSLGGTWVGAPTGVRLRALGFPPVQPLGTVVKFGDLAGAATKMELEDTVGGVAVDARYNHWGLYNRSAIRSFITDDGTGNSVDVSCFRDVDRFTPVCPPTADFAFSPAAPLWNRNVEFTDTSVSGGRAIDSREWSFSDGGSASGAAVSHKFAHSGTYDATLTITDEEGYEDSVTKTVVVSNTAPVLNPLADVTVTEGSGVVIWVKATDAESDVVSYSFPGKPPGAGSSTASNGSAWLSWTPGYDAAGDYSVTARASDGELETSATFVIHVLNHPDAVAPVSVEGHAGTPGPDGWYVSNVQFTLSASDSGGSGVRGIFHKMDGGAIRVYSSVFKPTFTVDGVHTLDYWAMDNAGNVEAAKSVTVKIDKTAPVVSITDPEPFILGTAFVGEENVTFVVSATDGAGSGIAQVKYFLDGVLVKIDTAPTGPYFYEWDASSASIGRHVFAVKVSDGVGFLTERSLSILRMPAVPA